MNPYDRSTWTFGAPIVDALIMGNWAYIPYKWSDSPILITFKRGPLCCFVDFQGEHLPQPPKHTKTEDFEILLQVMMWQPPWRL